MDVVKVFWGLPLTYDGACGRIKCWMSKTSGRYAIEHMRSGALTTAQRTRLSGDTQHQICIPRADLDQASRVFHVACSTTACDRALKWKRQNASIPAGFSNGYRLEHHKTPMQLPSDRVGA